MPPRARRTPALAPASSHKYTLADARREVVRRSLPFRVENGKRARFEWGQLGLTLAQRDRAVDELIAAGEARFKPSAWGLVVEPASMEAQP